MIGMIDRRVSKPPSRADSYNRIVYDADDLSMRKNKSELVMLKE